MSALTAPSGTALLVVDMQNDFVRPDGAITVAGAEATLPAAARLLALARAEGWHVVHAIREHRADATDVEPFRVAPFRRAGGWAVPGTWGAQIVSELAPAPGEHIVTKTRFSAFMHTHLDAVLRRLGVTRLVVCGTQWPNCIRASATDALSLDYDVIVVASATSAATPEVAAANVRDLEHVGVRCPGLAELERSLVGTVELAGETR